jgi:hypothetical protein
MLRVGAIGAGRYRQGRVGVEVVGVPPVSVGGLLQHVHRAGTRGRVSQHRDWRQLAAQPPLALAFLGIALEN